VKVCFKCREAKPRSEFYRHPAMGDGLLGKCKECTKKDAAAVRLAKIDHYRAYDRMRASAPHRRAQSKRIWERWKSLNPKRRAAQIALGNAVRSGKIKPLPCLICGSKSEAHHPDYDTPLNVVWLCPPHHKQAHALARKAA
jgi:hypothetical protein